MRSNLPASFNRNIIVIAGLLFVMLIAGLYIMQQHVGLPSLNLGNLQQAKTSALRLPAALMHRGTTYGDTPKPTEEPVAQSMPEPTPVADMTPAGHWNGVTTTPHLPPAPAWQGDAYQGTTPTQSTTPAEVFRQVVQAEQSQTQKKKWGIKPTNLNRNRGRETSQTKGKPEAAQGEQDMQLLRHGRQQRESPVEALLQHAIWARPAKPDRTLYKQQSIPGVMMDTIISDIPGKYKVRVSVPVFARFKRPEAIEPDELIPKDAIVIIRQEAVPAFGQKRLQLFVEEIQLPTPEVIKLKASVGDGDGAQGVSGQVNNHYGKLALATLISTAINIGGRVMAGNPSGYNYNVAQELVREAGAQVSQDAKSIVDKSLRIPPTITISKDVAVSIGLDENIMFSRQPVVIP